MSHCSVKFGHHHHLSTITIMIMMQVLFFDNKIEFYMKYYLNVEAYEQ